jgi:hypothetical protein
MVGAFLEARNQHQVNAAWFDSSLLPAAQWLRENNPYIAAYGNILQQYVDANNLESTPYPVWPTAEHMPQDPTAPPVIQGDVIVPNYDFPDEIHNEDSHYSRLMAGFLQINDNNRIPISFSSPDLEALLFLIFSLMAMVTSKTKTIPQENLKLMESTLNIVSKALTLDFVCIQHGQSGHTCN